MIQRTLSDVIDPLRRVASQAGLRADDVRLTEYINIAQERLLSKTHTIVGTIHRLKFYQVGGVIALPSRYERLLKGGVNGHKGQVMDQWYEFMDYGPGFQDTPRPNPVWGRVDAFIDYGESPVIRQSTERARYVRVYSYVDERVSGNRPVVTVYGYDENGQWVRSERSGVWGDGIDLPLNGDLNPNYAQSTVLFTKVTQVKKPVTNGIVELYYYDGDYDETVFAARYDYWETNPSLRLYFFPIAQDKNSVVHALCKVRYRDALNPGDQLIISSLPALRLAMRALAKEDADQITEADALWTSAKQVLCDEAFQYYGTAKPLFDPQVTAPVGGGVYPII
jgi:hypothetical protein